MGSEDMRRQALNVFRMRLLGAEVIGVDTGSCTLKDAISEAMRDWAANFETTHYMLGSALGPHPYPMIVRDFQRVIGCEAREQFRQISDKDGPDLLIACVGGGSNAIGLFHPFLGDGWVDMVGVEAGGRGEALGEHAARFAGGVPGVLQGTKSYILQDDDGQIALTHSVSAGLDYASVGAGARLAERRGKGELHFVFRLGCARGRQDAIPSGRHHPSSGISPRGSRGDQASASRQGPGVHRQSFRPGRQGHRNPARKHARAGLAKRRAVRRRRPRGQASRASWRRLTPSSSQTGASTPDRPRASSSGSMANSERAALPRRVERFGACHDLPAGNDGSQQISVCALERSPAPSIAAR